ncbi:MAG: type II toxin-antitoxin system RelE/ParE family toxin [Kiritimatiellae bacterium]|nr:type II toxin-antitoxin system RelE/ParE family toxin [Kiritimatiellia bacterium]
MDLVHLDDGARFTLYAIKIGNSVDEFLADLQKKNPAEHARTMARLKHLADDGPSANKTEFNTLGHDLYETKTSGGARIIFFYDDADLVLCAHAFMKKSQRTPRRMIETADKRRSEYLASKGKTPCAFRIIMTTEQEKPKRFPR